MEKELIYESKKSKLYRLDSSEWGKPALLKILNHEFPTPFEITQFYNEFDIIENHNIDFVRKPLKRSKFNGRHCMYLDWIEGQTLKEAFKGKHEDVEDFLHIAIALADVLGKLHERNIVHKDINPNNILVDLQARDVHIISFGIASKLSSKEQHLGNPDQLEGTLAYMSPEQTGRMNRVVDFRSDLYSLGITFYEMLNGGPPFNMDDPLELVHCHLANYPKPIHLANSKVPKVISDVIDLLLKKKAENRYQSALGLKHDLESCLQAFLLHKKIDSFPLRTNDFSGKFTLAQNLYGRDEELKNILKKFEIAADGGLEMVLISGYSGTGKSALVHEIHKPITEKKGYFIEGKFDQLQRSVPYFALIQAFNTFMDLLLTEHSEKFQQLKNIILESVGEEGKVLTDVLPSLELVIGTQPDVPEIGGIEAQNRFNYVFRKFVSAISTKEHPIALFIDDLQWADSSSLSLLFYLITDQNNGYLFCIGAYRDNEVSPSHPLMISIEDMRNNQANICDIKIGNLPIEDVNLLIADSLLKPVEQCSDLTNLVYKKTQGNAFFTTQFLKSLYEEKLLYFNFDKKVWEYSLGKIEEQNITDNVVELIASNIKKLTKPTQESLKLAACIGSKFDIEIVSIIQEKEIEATQKDFQEALLESLILRNGDQFKFAHDRIQQAVYSLIADKDKDVTHLNIGRLLIKNLKKDKQGEFLFDIVNHFNIGISLITDSEEKEMLTQLNLQAGKKAKESSAFKLALDYLEKGITLLKPDSWNSNYQTTLELYALAGETAYLNGDFKKMDIYISQVIENANELLHKVKSYGIRILAFKAENKLLDAIKTGLELLAQLGEKFPKNPKLPHVMAGLIKSKITLRGKSNETLADLPTMVNEDKIAAMRIMADIASSSYWATPTLFPLIIFRMVYLSLKYGNTALSSFAFSTYGVIMCGVLGDMKSGYRFGKLGLALLDQFNAKEWKTQVYTPVYCLIVNWNEHIDKTLKPLQESYHIGMETGAIEFACINTNIYCIHAYLSGKPLERLEIETKSYSQSFDQFNQETNFNYNEVYHQAMLNLMGRSNDPVIMTGEAFDEVKMIKQNDERNDQTGQFFIHFNKLILSYLFGEYNGALEHAQESRKLLEAVLSKFEIPNHHFFEALTMLALYKEVSFTTRIKYMRRVKQSMRQLKTWSKDAPENFQHKYDLLKAERMRVVGNASLARLHYDKAIKGASKNYFIHEEGIAYELAGKFYLEEGSEKLAEFYFKGSYNAYREWGGKAKLLKLERDYPQYVSGISSANAINTVESTQTLSSTITGGLHLDMKTVLKSSSIISSEIVLEKLLYTLIKIVMENAGAERGFLLLNEGDEYFIQAQSEDSGKNIEVLKNKPFRDSNLVSESIISYVTQSKNSIVVKDAQNEPICSKDPYIKNKKVQSILSLPIINRSHLTGVLYLENNLVTGAFKQDRLELLSLLSSQIAVSIENALLYENLEQKVTERTEELEEEKHKSDKLLLNILPFEIAEELRTKGTTLPRKFKKVTVMFTDFQGFTQLSETMSPEELVNELDKHFSAFDEIIGKYKLEKIKTIGDSYMCVGGLPVPNSTHATDTVKAGLEILEYMEKNKEYCKLNGKPIFEMRIGLHSGPVIAGVVGSKKFVYDIWGDAVNTASRMESSGVAGKLNVSETTYESIKNDFNCTFRGKIEAKNKGEIDMYFVDNK